MTAVVDFTARVLDVPETSGSRAGWTQWLTDRLEPGWRPGEWNPQTWFFDGDPANEFTAAGLCEVTSCGVKTDGPRMCALCQKAFQVSTLSREQFVTTHESMRKRKIPNGAAERCVVNRDGTVCAAPAHCMGLCHSHYSSFRYVARTKGRSLQTSLNSPIEGRCPPLGDRNTPRPVSWASYCGPYHPAYGDNYSYVPRRRSGWFRRERELRVLFAGQDELRN